MRSSVIVLILTGILSGCNLIEKNKSYYNTEPDSENIEDIDISYDNLGTYIDRYGFNAACSDFSGERSIVNESGVKAYSDLSNSILDNIDSALGCEVAIPLIITEHDSYEAIAKENGVYLTKGIFEESDYVDEIVFILSHELVHYVLEHPKRVKEKHLLIEKENQEMGKTLDSPKTESLFGEGSIDFLTAHSKNAFTLNEKDNIYRIKNENEQVADYLGVDILVQSGYSPQALVHNIDKMASCLNYEEGDFNNSFDELNKKHENFNASKNKSMDEYLNLVGGTLELTGDHISVPWREQMILGYIKSNYSELKRKRMVPN